jgi:hypothetical protein
MSVLSAVLIALFIWAECLDCVGLRWIVGAWRRR